MAGGGGRVTVSGVVTGIHVPRGSDPRVCRCGAGGDLDRHLQEVLDSGVPLLDHPRGPGEGPGDPALREAAAAVVARGWDTLAGWMLQRGLAEPVGVVVVADRHGVTVVGDPAAAGLGRLFTAATGVTVADDTGGAIAPLQVSGPVTGPRRSCGGWVITAEDPGDRLEARCGCGWTSGPTPVPWFRMLRHLTDVPAGLDWGAAVVLRGAGPLADPDPWAGTVDRAVTSALMACWGARMGVGGEPVQGTWRRLVHQYGPLWTSTWLADRADLVDTARSVLGTPGWAGWAGPLLVGFVGPPGR